MKALIYADKHLTVKERNNISYKIRRDRRRKLYPVLKENMAEINTTIDQLCPELRKIAAKERKRVKLSWEQRIKQNRTEENKMEINEELIRKLTDLVETLKNANPSVSKNRIELALEEARKEIRETGALFSLSSFKVKYGLNSPEREAIKKELNREFEFIGNRKVWCWRLGAANRVSVKPTKNATKAKFNMPKKLVEVMHPVRKLKPNFWTKEEKELLEKMVDEGKKVKEIIKHFKGKSKTTVKTFCSGYKRGDKTHYVPSYGQKRFNPALKERAKQRKLTATEMEQFAKELEYGSPLKNVATLLGLKYNKAYYTFYKAKGMGLISKNKILKNGQLVVQEE